MAVANSSKLILPLPSSSQALMSSWNEKVGITLVYISSNASNHSDIIIGHCSSKLVHM